MTADDRHIYKGELLKQPPLPRNHRKVASMLRSPFYSQRALPSLCVVPFGECCGIRILEGFKHWQIHDEELKADGRISDVNLSANIYRIKIILDKKLELRSDISLGNQGKPYLIAALNEEQMQQGIHCVLQDYFGFARLEDDFKNIGRAYVSPRICIMGLCLSSFSEENM